MTTAADFQPIISAVIAVVAAMITGLAAWYIPRLIAAFERRTGVMITDQERAALMSAVTTGTGLLQTRLDLKLLRPVDILPGNEVVLKEAKQALARVPDAAAGQGATIDTAAAMIAARVDTTPRPAVVAGTAAYTQLATPVPLAAGT